MLMKLNLESSSRQRHPFPSLTSFLLETSRTHAAVGMAMESGIDPTLNKHKIYEMGSGEALVDKNELPIPNPIPPLRNPVPLTPSFPCPR